MSDLIAAKVWKPDGSTLMLAAGCHVGIKVTEAKSRSKP